MAGVISEVTYDQMKKELGDVINIFLDDTKNSEQTIQLITEIAHYAVAVQGLSAVEGTDKKLLVKLAMVLELFVEQLKQSLLTDQV